MGVLTEIVGRIDQDRIPAHTRGERVLGRAHHRLGHLRHHVGVADPVRPRPRHRPSGVTTDDADPEFGRDTHQIRIGARPGVIDQVGARVDGGPRHLGAPGVDADQQLGIFAPDGGDERHHPAGLLGRVDQIAGTGFHPADIDHVRALVDSARDRVHGGRIAEGRALVVEGVGRPVDDGHDQSAIRRHRPAAQSR